MTLGVWYSQPYRLDVYVNNVHVKPNNFEWVIDRDTGERIYNLKPEVSNQQNQYLPTPSDPIGNNWFQRKEGILYFTIRGSSPVEVRTHQTVIVSFKIPPQTIDQFFGPNIVRNLALFFDLPAI